MHTNKNVQHIGLTEPTMEIEVVQNANLNKIRKFDSSQLNLMNLVELYFCIFSKIN